MGTIVTKYNPGVQIGGDDWLTLHRNENLFAGSDWTVDAASRLLREVNISSYPDPNSQQLCEALAELYGVTPENIFVGNGSDEVLSDLLGLLRHTYDCISVTDICFKVYLLLANRFNFQVARLPGNTFQTGSISVEGFRGLAVIDSPNSITGHSLSRESLLSLAKDEDDFLIWDNVYGDFGDQMLPKPLPKNMVIVRSFSKFYGLAGLRVGYCIADSAIISELLARKDAFNVNAFAQVMAYEALQRRETFQSLSCQMLACREELVTELRQRGFRMHKPSGNFLFATHPGFSAKFIQTELLKKQIAVRHFEDGLTQNHIRIAIPPRAGVLRLIEALGDIIQKGTLRQ